MMLSFVHTETFPPTPALGACTTLVVAVIGFRLIHPVKSDIEVIA